MSWNYNAQRRSGLAATGPDGFEYPPVSYAYNNGTRTITQGGLVTTYTPQPGMLQPATVSSAWSGGAALNRGYGYDVLGRTTGVVGAVGSTVVSASGSGAAPITYDPAGRRTDIVREDGTKWHYDYNSRNEVTAGRKSFSDNTAVPGHQFTYGYDGIGNRLTASTGGDPNGTGLEELFYTPNALNQYSAFTNPSSRWITGEAASGANVVVNDAFTWRHGGFFARKLDLGNASGPAGTEVTIKANMPPGDGTMVSANRTGRLLTGPANVSPQYDDDGNLLTDGLWTYTWDGENRLKSAETASSLPTADKRKLEYAYDFEGRLVKITKYTHTGTDWVQESATLLLYDGWNILAEINGTGVKKFLWGPDLSGTLEGAGGIGGLLAMTDSASGKTALAVGDANGNVSALVDATTGEVVARYGYGPFGEPLQAAGPLAKANPFRWSSKYSDNETGLVYYGYRFYSPETGRWISRDPIGEIGGENLYGFCENSSVNQVDCLGLQYMEITPHIDSRLYWYGIASQFVEGEFALALLHRRIWEEGDWNLSAYQVKKYLKPIANLEWSKQFKKDLSSREMPFTGDYKIQATDTANLSGGLNSYTIKTTNIKVECWQDPHGNMTWIARGKAEIFDRWDFDWKLLQYMGGLFGGPGNGREFSGQYRTMGGSLIPGKNFDVRSEKIDVEQKGNESDLVFKY